LLLAGVDRTTGSAPDGDAAPERGHLEIRTFAAQSTFGQDRGRPVRRL